MSLSPISFGAWAIGGSWGTVDDEESMRALHAAIDSGVNFIDTADVYGDGRSERLVARLRRERSRDPIYVATKAGRKLPVQTADGYSRQNLTAWIDASLRNLRTDTIDLLQLHCPHPDVYDRPEVFGVLDDFVAAGKLRYYGVSVETVDEARRALRYPNVQSIQIIFNLFRMQAGRGVLRRGRAGRVGIIARVPLASGLLTGRLIGRVDVRRRRSPALQSSRRAVRSGRDVLRCAVRGGTGGGRGAAPARAGGRDARAVRAAMDPDVGRGHVRDSRARRRPPRFGTTSPRPPCSPLDASNDGRRARRLRSPHPPARPPPMVGRVEVRVSVFRGQVSARVHTPSVSPKQLDLWKTDPSPYLPNVNTVCVLYVSPGRSVGAREVRVVRRVRVVLRLEAEARPLRIHAPALAR